MWGGWAGRGPAGAGGFMCAVMPACCLMAREGGPGAVSELMQTGGRGRGRATVDSRFSAQARPGKFQARKPPGGPATALRWQTGNILSSAPPAGLAAGSRSGGAGAVARRVSDQSDVSIAPRRPESATRSPWMWPSKGPSLWLGWLHLDAFRPRMTGSRMLKDAIRSKTSKGEMKGTADSPAAGLHWQERGG